MDSKSEFALSVEREKYLREMIGCWQAPPPSECGLRCADLLSTLVGGLHHLDGGEQVNWSDPRYVDITLSYPAFSTFDYSTLTHLVFLCHDRCIRAEIKGATKGRLRLMLWPRNVRDGDMNARHPTIEAALAVWRQANPAETVQA